MIQSRLSGVLSAAFLLFVTSCSVNHRIRYSLEDIRRAGSARMIDTVLDIQPLIDARRQYDGNAVLFEAGRETELDGQRVCVNSEAHYAKGSVPLGLSLNIAKHLRRRGRIRQVTTNRKDTADFYLSGELWQFYAEQEYSTAAGVGAAFGVIGALATAGKKTPGMTVIEMTNLTIHSRDGQVVMRLADVFEVFEGEYDADPYCWAPYGHIDARLKYAIDKLAKNAEAALAVLCQNVANQKHQQIH